MSEYKVVINGSEYCVEVLSVADGKASVRVNGTDYEADVIGSSESLMVSSSEPTRSRDFSERKVGNRRQVERNGARSDFRDAKEENDVVVNGLERRRGLGVSPSKEGRKVQAPLPGVVLAVNVKEGQSVQRGQKLAVIVAMKMENDILAPIDGVVSSITASVGDSVLEGDGLMTIN